MPDEIVDEVVGTGVTKIGGSLRRGVIEETVSEGGGHVSRSKPNGNALAIEDDEIRDGGHGSKKPLKESTKKLLAVVDDDEPEDTDDETTVDPDDEGLVEKKDPDDTDDETSSKKEAKTDDRPEEKKEDVKDEKPSDYDEIRSDRDRLADTNRQLVQDLESERKRPRNEMNERMKALDEAERTYLDDPVKAYRQFVATVLNVKPDSKEVDEELSGFYTDLTAKELQVPLEAAHKATREAARTKQQLARDKRERLAESEANKNPSNQDTDSQKETQASQFITRMFNDKQELREKYPLTMQLSEQLDNLKPEVLIWKVIERDSKAGVIKVTDNDVDTVEQALKLIEAHYESVVETVSKAKTKKADTTKQAETKSNANDSKEKTRQGQGTHTITNANASRAPSVPPVKKQPEQQAERPKFKSKKEAQDWALRHIPD